MGRRAFRILPAVALAIGAGLVAPIAAMAHPLGNFTINHYAGITVSSSVIHLDLVIDMAEIPAFQERQALDTNRDGTVDDSEAAAGAATDCAKLVGAIRLGRDGTALALSPTAQAMSFPPGAGGLSTLRLECGFDATLAPGIGGPTTIDFVDQSYTERIGWREIVAVADGVALDSHGLPTTSPSQRLTAYPVDQIALPLDVRSASLTVRPGGVPLASAGPAAVAQVGGARAATGGAVPGGVSVADLPEIFRTADLTPAILLVSLITAAGLGAAHALTPGHGKSLMAAYLVGSRGSPVHAVGLGMSVAVSHTLGIFVLALLIVGAQDVLAPDVIVRTTPIIAAISIVAIGGVMLWREVRQRIVARRLNRAMAVQGHHGEGEADHHHIGSPPGHDHGHDHGHELAHTHELARTHELAHTYEPVEDANKTIEHFHDGTGEHSHGGLRHSHLPAPGVTLSWRSLFVLGLAGGLIPSASALIILLASIASGRPAYGLVLVVAFGIGMAAVMTGVGLAMIVARSRLDRMPRRSSLGRLAAHAPLFASIFLVGLGLVLTLSAVAGKPVL